MEARNKIRDGKRLLRRSAQARRRFSRKELMILLIPCAAAILTVLVVLLTMDKGSTYVFRENARQYYGGSSAVIPEGTKMKRMEDGAVQLENGEENDGCLPAYYESGSGFILTGDMLYYTPRDADFGLLRAFSEVSRAANGLITMTYESTSVHPEQGFLFDGRDLYVFLEPVRVSCMGYAIDLPALSYAEVINGSHVMLFNYETKDVFLELLDGSVFAETVDGAYTVSLLGDSMTDWSGESTLLAGQPEIFDSII